MCRYLITAQLVPICGLSNFRSFGCAVTMRQTLYVTERQLMGKILTRVFMYLDYSDLHHEDPRKRKISCSNKRPLVLNGLVGSAELFVPCLHSNTFYVHERRPHLNEIAVVHRVKQDGTELLQWPLDRVSYTIRSMALNPSGLYLAVTSY